MLTLGWAKSDAQRGRSCCVYPINGISTFLLVGDKSEMVDPVAQFYRIWVSASHSLYTQSMVLAPPGKDNKRDGPLLTRSSRVAVEAIVLVSQEGVVTAVTEESAADLILQE